MKFIHFADAHIGVGADSPIDGATGLPGRILDFLDSMDGMINFAEDEKVDFIIFAGDMYHRCNPTPTIVREVSKRVVRMSSLCPVIMIPGNHDTPGSRDKATAVDIFSTLKVNNVHILDDYGVRPIDGLWVTSFPMPIRRHLLTDAELKRPGNALFKQRIKDLINHLGDKVGDAFPSVFLGHFSLNGAVYGSERDMVIGDVAEVNAEWVTYGAWEYIALGHIHKQQQIGNAAYSGSLDRVSFHEESDPKGFMLVTLDDGMLPEFVEIDTRPWVTIRVNAENTRHPTAKVIKKITGKNLQGAIVRVLVEVDEGAQSSILQSDIYDELRKAGVWQVLYIQILERRQDHLARLELGKSASAISHADLLAEYFSGMKPSERQALLGMADKIFKEVKSEQTN